MTWICPLTHTTWPYKWTFFLLAFFSLCLHFVTSLNMLGFGFGYFSAIPVNKGTLMDPNGPLNENLDRLYDGPLTLFVYTEYEI